LLLSAGASGMALAAVSQYTPGDSDVISFQLVFAAMLWVKLGEMFVTMISLKYALSVS